MRIKCILLLLAASLFCAGFAGCGSDDAPPKDLVVSGESVAVEKEPTPGIDDMPLVDNPYFFSQDDEDSVVTMYLTVSRGSSAENTDHSWAEINGYSVYDYAEMGVDRFQVEGLLQVGDEKGPVAGQLGFGLKAPNAIVQTRGATTSRMPQKSFKIEVKPDSGLWHQQRTIALNKHIFDGLRFRNKLCYDLLRDIPDMISLRTQFVHLYVKDETDKTGKASKGFVDYGLFTQVEQPNTRFLRNHGLDSNGQFYKMNFFEFYRYPDAIKLKTDPNYDKQKFESLLEIKGNDDHSKLIQMLDEVNDYGKPIEAVFEKYFNADNYFTWLAFNILMGNIDTQSRNNYLYSPQNSNKWYYIAWDCDAALTRYEYKLLDMDTIGYEYGISNYWGDIVFNRVMRIAKYRAILDEKIEALRKIITPQRLYAMASEYEPVVKKYLFKMPDVRNSRFTLKQYDAMVKTFADELDLNYRLYKLSLQMPMPFYLDVPVPHDGQLQFKWDASFDLDGQDITYTFELSKSFLFTDPIVKEEGLHFPTVSTKTLAPGKYFYRVRATNEDGKTQVAMIYYVENSVKHYGVQDFYVMNDGSVRLEANHE